MKTLKRTFVSLTVFAMMALGPAFAQDDQQQDQDQQNQNQQTQQEQSQQEQSQQETTTRTVEIRGEEVAPLGQIQVGESQPLEEAETQTVEVEVQTGAIVISATTPSGESPNVDLVGPNGYYEHFEISLDDNGQHVVQGLLPGVYSVAATDDDLQVAHTLVEVTGGQAISVDITLEELAAYEEGSFQPDAATSFPDEAYETAEPQTTENAEFGRVSVDTESDNARFVVTGPNNYSQEFSGAFTAEELPPGVYVIAGTVEEPFAIEGTLTGAQIATSAVAVNVSQAVTMVPVYDVVGAETEQVEAEAGEVEDVAGGGEATQQQQEQDQQEQDQQEQDQQDQDQQQQDQQEQDQQQQDQEQEQQEGTAEGEEVAGGGEAQQEQTVQVGLDEYTIDMPMQIQAGTVTFEISNDGEEEHNFEIEGQGVEKSLDQNLQPGESGTLTVDLQPGTYKVYCPVDDHEQEGMTMQLEVTEQGN